MALNCIKKSGELPLPTLYRSSADPMYNGVQELRVAGAVLWKVAHQRRKRGPVAVFPTTLDSGSDTSLDRSWGGFVYSGDIPVQALCDKKEPGRILKYEVRSAYQVPIAAIFSGDTGRAQKALRPPGRI